MKKILFKSLAALFIASTAVACSNNETAQKEENKDQQKTETPAPQQTPQDQQTQDDIAANVENDTQALSND